MALERKEIKRPGEVEGVVFLLYDTETKEFFIVQNVEERSEFYGHYIIPGGKIKKGETPEEAARREILEELGVTVKEIILLDTCTDMTLNGNYCRFHAYLVLDWDGEVKGLEPEKSILIREDAKGVNSKLTLSLSRLVLVLARLHLITLSRKNS